jgi:hypothetical protein
VCNIYNLHTLCNIYNLHTHTHTHTHIHTHARTQDELRQEWLTLRGELGVARSQLASTRQDKVCVCVCVCLSVCLCVSVCVCVLRPAPDKTKYLFIRTHISVLLCSESCIYIACVYMFVCGCSFMCMYVCVCGGGTYHGGRFSSRHGCGLKRKSWTRSTKCVRAKTSKSRTSAGIGILVIW